MRSEILSLLGDDHPWNNLVQWHEQVASTNDHAKELAVRGAPHGTVILANRQTGGRGRMGRTFLSPGGMGVYLSVILRPQCKPEDLMHLTCAAAVAACDAVSAATGLNAGIKWTNDLVISGRKLGGILTELSFSGDRIDYAIIGIGINCRQSVADFDTSIRSFAGSLNMFACKSVSTAQVAAELIRSLQRMDEHLISGKEDIMERYRHACITVGKQISLLRGDTVKYGFAESIDESGALTVRFDDGSLQTVTSGEVSIRGMYGYV